MVLIDTSKAINDVKRDVTDNITIWQDMKVKKFEKKAINEYSLLPVNINIDMNINYTSFQFIYDIIIHIGNMIHYSHFVADLMQPLFQFSLPCFEIFLLGERKPFLYVQF